MASALVADMAVLLHDRRDRLLGHVDGTAPGVAHHLARHRAPSCARSASCRDGWPRLSLLAGRASPCATGPIDAARPLDSRRCGRRQGAGGTTRVAFTMSGLISLRALGIASLLFTTSECVMDTSNNKTMVNAIDCIDIFTCISTDSICYSISIEPVCYSISIDPVYYSISTGAVVDSLASGASCINTTKRRLAREGRAGQSLHRLLH